MITRNPMQLKALIKNMAKEKNISAQLVLQSYLLERLLERISLSRYRSNFILKGGFLIASIVGLDTRATMDLDTTVKGFPLTPDTAREAFTMICRIPAEDDVAFEVLDCAEIRENENYPGIRVSLRATYLNLAVPLKVDMTAGDPITPAEIEYKLSLLFDNRKISVLAYNLETILAEKIETILSRGIANTRPRDFYDVYILSSFRKKKYRPKILKQALDETSMQRGSMALLPHYDAIMQSIESDAQMSRFWLKYQKEFAYAKGIEFSQVCNSVREVCRCLD
jgi:predicted nucleotidyltransferase component of viral defense system